MYFFSVGECVHGIRFNFWTSSKVLEFEKNVLEKTETKRFKNWKNLAQTSPGEFYTMKPKTEGFLQKEQLHNTDFDRQASVPRS
jgi:hypothetical protein